ncbi:unnamed protein product [Clavelina lepadiformis]|uniref:VWFA domain-containing protein n=1 Tax=Clavelina lepadiformis TaxID=159417 RepID=A0ABP0GLK2_CLALP
MIDNSLVALTPKKEENGRLLRTKYFCRADNCGKVDVVMELSADDKVHLTDIPQRYVLVIDVSGSMCSTPVEDDPRSLLDRVKSFIKLFTDNATEETWISLVTFNHTAEIRLPMTNMNELGKTQIQETLQLLEPDGGTNISDGLFEALRVVNCNEITKDCIILFTDGDTNNRICDADELVEEYNKKVIELSRANKVQLAALTIGCYMPDFLESISARLGSDAFYWLNTECDFEADMLIPMFLRQIAHLTDIKLELTCLENVTFSEDAERSERNLLTGTDKKQTCFIHHLPSTMIKHIMFTLRLPENYHELNCKEILQIRKDFLDHYLSPHHGTNNLELHLQCPHSSQLSESVNAKKRSGTFKYLETRSAYMMEKDMVKTSWKHAQQSIGKLFLEECRNLCVTTLETSFKFMENDEKDSANIELQNTKASLQKIKENIRQVLGEKNSNLSDIKCGQWLAMTSSFSTEMPTATGVFDTEVEQPFLPEHVRQELQKFQTIIQEETKTEEDVVLQPDLNDESLSKKDQKEKSIKPKRIIEETPGILQDVTVVLSESLAKKKVGTKKELISEVIIRLGGKLSSNVGAYFDNTILICSKEDYDRKSKKIKQASRNRIPIVKESLIFDCIMKKRIVNMRQYLKTQMMTPLK